jgi:hypothetical protein
MRNLIISSLLIIVLGVCIFIVCSGDFHAVAGEALDGKSYSINYTEYGKSGNPTKDVLIFKDGKFESEDCEQYGFGPAIYESASKDGATLFEATTTSEKEGKIEWEGKVEGDSITGNFMWSKPGQEPILYTYSGSIKK